MRPSRPMIARVGSDSSRHQITSVRSPNVQIIAMPDPLVGRPAGARRTGTSTPNSGVVTVEPDELGVPLVVRVRDQRDAGGEQLGSRRLDHDRGAIGAVERDPVVRRWPIAIFELGLRHRRPERHVPERRCLGLVGLTAGEVAQEAPAGTRRGRCRRSSGTASTSRPTARAGATRPRTPSRPRG